MAKTSKLKRNVLTISITIIFALFIGFGIETFYESPDYDDYCDVAKEQLEVSSEDECKLLNGTWNAYPKMVEGNRTGYCDLYENCRNKWDEVNESYNKNIFIITFIIGLIALVLGSYFVGVESVGSGIMGGGTLTIIYGTIRYWSDLNDLMRFIILGIVLFILIWIGYKKIKE